MQVKLLEREGEMHVLAKRDGRIDKDRAMRCRSLRKALKRLKELQQQKLTRDALLMKLGAANKEEVGRAYALVDITVPPKGQRAQTHSFVFTRNRQKLRAVRRHEAHYLLADRRHARIAADAGQLRQIESGRGDDFLAT